MAEVDGPGIDIAGLRRALRAVDPAAALVPPRLLRRALRRDRGLSTFGPRAPRRETYAIDGKAAVEILGRGPLGLGPLDEPPSALLLVAEPDRRDLAAMPRAEALSWCWRRLFRARVHAAAASRLAGEGLRERIGPIGPVAFEEARAVLRQEGALLDPEDDGEVFAEFAAAFLELWHFAPDLLPATFPALRDPEAAAGSFAPDLDACALLVDTRPDGAPPPVARCGAPPDRDGAEDGPEASAADEPRGAGGPAEGFARATIRRADEARAHGNLARSAILRTRAARRDPSRFAARARAGARADLEQLARRLKRALELDGDEARRWRGAIPALLERSAGGGWTAEARLLYDLQKACVDHERGVFELDLLGWLRGLGRRPIKRPLPDHREVLISRHLRRAERRLASTRLAEGDRARLAPLLRDAVHGAEGRLRDRFRPRIAEALRGTGLVPANLPERVALAKLIEELLDRVVERGFVAMGDLRDGLSRSNLKLPDLSPGAFVRGDRLLGADRRLAAALRGVYRRGEIYLRVLQRLSALAFGTPAGRALTRYVALPFGGAFLILAGLQHLVGIAGVHVELVSRPSVLTAGIGILALTHVEDFRAAVVSVLRWSYRAVRWALLDLPSWVLKVPFVRRVIESRAFALFRDWAYRPLIAAAIVGAATRALGVGRLPSLVAGSATFLATGPLLNSSHALDLEEAVGDALIRGWHRLLSDILPGLFRLIMETFGRILEAIDRVLYGVDEWLRFRAGQGRWTLAGKAVLGALWAVIAYVVRICVNLLIEPQVNPVKHFPVVTVSHKVLFPIMLHARKLLIRQWPAMGDAIFGTTTLLLPGFFGFLVWELKENWRLYEANRPGTLRPVAIGHHGETMARLLRPGFHSGTIPKLFARLRRAERDAPRSGRRRKAARKHRLALEHVEEAIRHFVDRDVLALPRDARRPGDPEIETGAIELATNRVLVELRLAGRAGPGLWFVFEERAGRLLAGIVDPGWLADLPPESRRPVEAALAGLSRMAGADAGLDPARPGLDPVPWRDWVSAWAPDAPEPALHVPA